MSNNDAWADAMREAESPDRDPGLWARCFAEADGDEAKAKAAYIQTRVTGSSAHAAAPKAATGFCPSCSAPCPMDALKCPSCFTQFSAKHKWVPARNPTNVHSNGTLVIAKSRGVYIILGLFFGLIGIHNFYVGRYAYAVMQILITLILGWFVIGLFITGFWVLVELVSVTKDGDGNRLS